MSDAPAPTPRPSGADDRERLTAVVADALETFQQRDGYQKAVIVEILEDFGAILAAPLLADLAAERTAREAAERERDEVQAVHEATCLAAHEEWETLTADRDRLAERVVALEAALKPFGEMAEVFTGHDEATVCVRQSTSGRSYTDALHVADFRYAARALHGTKGGSDV